MPASVSKSSTSKFINSIDTKLAQLKNEDLGAKEEPINVHTLSQLFAKNVYGLKQMQETLPKPVYSDLVNQMSGSGSLSKQTADAVAHAVKVWAIERGATHFTHWFQPQTNATAEKHDSFLSLKYNLDGNLVSV